MRPDLLVPVAQVKAAFWSTFHKSGELWFSYFGSDEHCETFTQEWWDTFAENLALMKGMTDGMDQR